MVFTKEESIAYKSIEPVARLLLQLFEYRRPGHYGFATHFPGDYTVFISAAATFRRSKNRELRSYGLAMRNLASGMSELDNLPENTWKFRRKLSAFRWTVSHIAGLSRRLSDKLEVNEDYKKDGDLL